MKNFIIALLSGLIFCGCSITPRYHSFGYNVEWKTRSKTRAKSSASTLSAKSQKRSHHDRNEIVGAVNSIESAKPVSSTEEKKVQFDTIRKNDISIPARIALDTTEKSVKKKKIDRNIKITNILLLGDLISIPLGLGLTTESDWTGIIYVLLIAFPLLIILLIARSIQRGIRRWITLDTTEKSVKEKKIDRNIKITNILLLGDLISILLGLGFAFPLLFPLLIILLIARSIQGGNRRKIFKNKNAIHDDREQIELWARQVAKGKITEEEFGQRVSEI